MSRIVFLGSPAVAAECLRALAAAQHEVELVVTGPDRRRGREETSSPGPVKAVALELGLPLSEKVEDVVRSGAELGVVVAFGRLVAAEVLERLPMVNLHFSLLPRWRGAAPVERAILAGDEVTGACVMQVAAGLDAGGIYGCTTTPIGPQETAAELTERLGQLGTGLLVERLRAGLAGLGVPTPQEGAPTYAAKITDEDRHLAFELPALQLQRIVRIGRAWTTWRGARVIVREASVAGCEEQDGVVPGTITGGRVATGEGFFVPEVVQPEGRRPQAFPEWLRGARPAPGERLGDGELGRGGSVS